jgi:hypothetical protein
MKVLLRLLLLLLIPSCFTIDKGKEANYCDQEIRLLQGNSSFEVAFDFNLLPEQQLKQLQTQIDFSLCGDVTLLNSLFEINDEKIEMLLTTDWYCIDSLNNLDSSQITCKLVRSQQVLINSNGQILIDGTLVDVNAISNTISKKSKDFFWKNSYKLVAYEIVWEESTDYNTRLETFKAVVDGYIQAANEIAKAEFGSELCKLDSTRLEALKNKFRFTFLIRKRAVHPPSLSKKTA